LEVVPLFELEGLIPEVFPKNAGAHSEWPVAGS